MLFMSAAVAAAPEPTQPTGKWTVEFADHDCILARPYGTTAKDTLILAFRKLPMSTGISIDIFKSGGQRAWGGGKAELYFGVDEPIQTGFAAYLVTSGLRRIDLWVADDSYKQAVRSGFVQVRVPHEINKTFAVPGLGPALSLLDQCALNLGELWGIPNDQQMRVGKPAKMINPYEVFHSSDYPDSAIREEASGRIVLRYLVDEAGKPSDCLILKSSGNRALDSKSCTLLIRRARFDPAQDAGGTSMSSLGVMRIDWLLFN